MTAAEQLGGVDRERAVGGEPAEHPGADQQPDPTASTAVGAATPERLEQQAERERPDDVDPEDRDRDAGEGGNGERQRLPRRRADRSAEGDERDRAGAQMNGTPGVPVRIDRQLGMRIANGSTSGRATPQSATAANGGLKQRGARLVESPDS